MENTSFQEFLVQSIMCVIHGFFMCLVEAKIGIQCLRKSIQKTMSGSSFLRMERLVCDHLFTLNRLTWSRNRWNHGIRGEAAWGCRIRGAPPERVGTKERRLNGSSRVGQVGIRHNDASVRDGPGNEFEPRGKARGYQQGPGRGRLACKARC